jgi:predicted rRNA methylase YqxC with S4 and FtsJ domains
VDLYGQEPEARLLGAFLSRLDNRTVIDVGAERGAFAQQMLTAPAAVRSISWNRSPGMLRFSVRSSAETLA